MEDKKKIIIDGVDVSACISFNKCNGKNLCCYDDTREDKIPFANFCVENKDCYFKQHSRKTAECEGLKEENKDLKDLNSRLDNMRETYYKEYLKLDNKLNEIYKIANTLITLTNEYDNCYYKDRCHKCKERKECQYYQVEKILNIINKAKGSNNERLSK